MLVDGEMVTGEVEARNRAAAINKLAEEGRTLFYLSDPDEEKRKWLPTPQLWFSKLSGQTVADLIRQLAEVLSAGVPLLETLSTLRRYSTNKKLTELLESLCKDISSGLPLSKAFEKHPDVFSPLVTSMVKVGEATGDLDGMMAKVADYLERDVELKSKVRSALTYPSFVLGFCTLLCYIMVAFLLPGFEPIWTQSGLDLSRYPLTELLLAISRMTHNWIDELLVVAVLIFIAAGTQRVLSTAEGARKASEAVLKIPVLGHFAQLAVTARVANCLATLVDAGVPLNQALRLAGEASANPLTKEAMENVAKSVEQGKPVAESLEKSSVFPPMLAQMVGIGEEAGRLPEMLLRVGSYYQKQLDRGVKNLSSLIEPVTMIVVGGIVGTFILGVILPIMGIVSSIKVG